MINPIKKLADPMRLYFVVLVVAVFSGMFFPRQLSFLAGNSTIILGIIFFLGALKIDLVDLKKVWHLKTTIIIFNFLMLIGLPVVVYLIAKAIVPEYAIALLILSAMPTGMATPFLADIVGGSETLSMMMTVTTSLLAPFTIPLVISYLVGVTVGVDFWQMFFSVAQIIFIPFLLAWVVRYFLPRVVNKLKGEVNVISIIFLGLLVAGIVAQQSSSIVNSLISSELFRSLGIVTVVVGSFYVLGYFLYFRKVGQDRLTLTVSFANMNFTLAIFLANKYFADPKIIVPITMAVVPWFAFIVIFKYLFGKSTS